MREFFTQMINLEDVHGEKLFKLNHKEFDRGHGIYDYIVPPGKETASH